MHESAERHGAVGQGRIPFQAIDFSPMGRRAVFCRRVQIVAKRRAERMLVAARDADIFDDGRPLVRRREKL